MFTAMARILVQFAVSLDGSAIVIAVTYTKLTNHNKGREQ